jgi:putative oxidoreductase
MRIAMNGGGTKLVFPGLADFYAKTEPMTYALMRVAIGLILFVHGWGKVMGPGATGVTNYFTSLGLPAPGALAYWAIFIETVGALCVAAGLFTRFFAAALAIEMLIAMFAAHWAKGFSVGQGGYEYVLLLGIVLLGIAIRGGGRYSVDSTIGKEL